MTRNKRPTIRDVAEEAGVSKSLVSLVYSDEDKVSPERKAAVLAAAKKLGFTPNFWARSLAAGASNFIGILVVDLHNPVYTEVADAIRVELLKLGHESFMTAAIMTEINGKTVVEPSTVQALLDLRPRGIVVIGDLPDEGPLNSVPDSIPVVKVFTVPSGTSRKEVNLRSDDEEGMRLVVDHLVSLGHSQIAYLGPTLSSVDKSRLNGFSSAMKKAGLTPILLETDRSTEGAYQRVTSELHQGASFTALVCFNDVVAVGALDAVLEDPDALNQAIAVTGYDNTHVSALKRMSITSVEQEKKAMAEEVAQLMSNAQTWTESVGQDIRVTPRLIIRDSSIRKSP